MSRHEAVVSMMRSMSRRRRDVAFYVPRMGPLLVADARSPTGGAETQILLLARALAERGVGVRLIVFALAGVELPESVDGVDVLVRPPYRSRERLGRIREIVHIARAVVRARAKVIVTRGATPEIGVAAVAAKLTGLNFVYASANVSDFRGTAYDSAHFDFSRFPRERLEWGLFRLAVRLADKVVVQTEEQVRLFEARFPGTPALIRSIAEPAPRRDAAPEAFLWIARLVTYKRPLAYVELARAVPEAKFWMIAPIDDPPDRGLERRLHEAAAETANLELLPPRPRPALLELIERAVAVVNTADFEGMPNILLEGWSRGVPALAMTHDPDGVIERHGLGCFAQGSLERLAIDARQLWETRGEQAAVAERCRRYVRDHHSPEVVAAQWQEAIGLRSAERAPET
jgi:glycosyltransferase involved in cell wall biosynthesis